MGCSSSTPIQSTIQVPGDASPDNAKSSGGFGGSRSGSRSASKDSVDLSKSFHAQYVLVGKLGKGAFAQVHCCRKVVDGVVSNKDLAVKITDLRKRINGKFTDEPDLRSQRSVEKEVNIMRKVGEQVYCVHQKEAFLEGCFAYIVMERCDMTLLQALERSTGLNEKVLSNVISDMFDGLIAIHGLGVVHRDLKPDNFLCSGGSGVPLVVKLCDFGLAALLPSGQADALSGVYGTAPFMSPEMLKSQAYGAKTDVWSIGVLLYVLLLGEFPYHPAETTSKAMKAAIVTGTPPPSFKPKAGLDMGGSLKVSSEASSFLYSLLTRDPSQRLDAATARSHDWLSATSGKDMWSSSSLRPMLYAAKRCGAFDTRNVNDGSNSDVDNFLAKMQERYHKNTVRRSHLSPADGSSEKDKHLSQRKDPISLINQSDVSTGAGSSSMSHHSKPSVY